MLTDKPTPAWKYTFAQSQPFVSLGECNDVEGFDQLKPKLSQAKGDLLISFDDGQNFARVGEVLKASGVKYLTDLLRDRDLPKNWKDSRAVFKRWDYWASKPDPKPTVWNNQYQKLSEFKLLFLEDLFQQLMNSLPPLRFPDLIVKEKDWTTPNLGFDCKSFIVDGAVTADDIASDTRDTQGQVGNQTPEQMQERIQNLKRFLEDARKGSAKNFDRWIKSETERSKSADELKQLTAQVENLQRTIKLMREGHDIAMSNAQRVDKNLEDAYVTIQKLEADLLVAQAGRQDANARIAALEHQHEADVNLAKTQAQVLRGYQQEVNDIKGEISKITADRDNMECEKVVAELELTLATRRSDAWELEARRRGYVGGGQ